MIPRALTGIISLSKARDHRAIYSYELTVGFMIFNSYRNFVVHTVWTEYPPNS